MRIQNFTTGFVLQYLLGISNAAMRQQGPQQFEACSFQSAYSNSFDDDLKDDDNRHTDLMECADVIAPISEVYECLSSFQLDRRHVIQHLQSTIDVLNDHYVFKDIAVNPLLPQKKTPFDYSIYNGTIHGQFDIISGLKGLLEKVKSENSATVDIFLQMNAFGAQLFDSHLHINQGISARGIIDVSWLHFYSSEVLDGTAQSTKLSLTFPSRSIGKEKSGFILTEEMTFSTRKTKKRIVQQIDGKDPLDFLTEIASQPLGFFNYKSVGARVQAMIQKLTGGYDDAYIVSLGTSHALDFSRFLKDAYEICYEDGSTSTWKLMQNVPRPVTCNTTASKIETLLGKPGKMYTDLESMKRSIQGSKFIPQKQEETKEQHDDVQSVARSFRDPSEEKPSVDFTMLSDNLGYKVYDDYAVLKVATFSRESDVNSNNPHAINESLLQKAWRRLTDEAHNKNVTKLVVDVITNGGGSVVLGYFLAHLLYPDATWEELADPYDRLYTPSMEDDTGELMEIMDTYINFIKDFGQVEEVTDKLNREPDLLIKKFESILSLLQSIVDILSSNEFKANSKASFFLEGTVLAAMESIKRTQTIVLQRLIAIEEEPYLSSSRTTTPAIQQPLEAEQLKTLWHILVNVAHEIFDFPYESFTFKGRYGAKFESSNPQVTKRVEYVRGGIIGNYTSPFYVLEPKTFTTWSRMTMTAHPHQFDDYILLSSGNSCGSTTDTFKNAMRGYAYMKNSQEKDSESITVPPFHTVSFGGTGIKEDSSTTQFSGGGMGVPTVVDLYLPALIFHALYALLHPGLDTEQLVSLLSRFRKVIPDACYYCDGPFTMPTYEIYSKVSGTDSIPLEYVKQVPDYYIRQWPTKTSFSGTDLPMLYKLTSRFFLPTTSTK